MRAWERRNYPARRASETRGFGSSTTRETFGGEPASNAPLIWAILGGAVAVVCVPLGLFLVLLKDVAEVRIDPDGAIRF